MDLTVHGVCPHDCYDTCGLDVVVRDGAIERIRGDREHPMTRGFLCFKVNRYLERLHHRDRILYPMRRVGPKGSGEFERVSWDAALTEIARRLGEIQTLHGGEAILPYSFAGNMGILSSSSMDARFFAAIGASRLDRTICTATATAVLRQMFGQGLGPDPETLPQNRLILLWGTNPMATNVHQIPLLDEAKEAGAKIWTIDPLYTETAARYQPHLAIRPNTDAILAMALGHYLIEHHLYNAEYVKQYARGFEAYRETVAPYSIERAAESCRVDPDQVRILAESIGTSRPLLIRPGYGMQRQRDAGLAVWAVSALAVITGAFLDEGGGLLISNGDAFPLNLPGLTRPDLAARLTRSINMIELGHALLETTSPPVEALLVYNSNPAATAPDQSRVLRGLSRDDLFLVVHEQMMTDTARYADFVLPAAMSMEVLDLHVSYWHRYVQLNLPAVPPAGESVSNPELFRRLAHAMGLSDPAFMESDEDLIRSALDTAHPYLTGVSLESLYQQPVQKLRLEKTSRPFVDTPVFTHDGFVHLEPLAGLDPHDDDPVGFHLLSPSRRETIKSSFANLPSFEHREPDPEILVSEKDAASHGWSTGQWVRLSNAHGETRCRIQVSSVPQPGTVVSYAVRWNSAAQGTNINQLTSDRLADFGGGATFYSTWVQIDPEEGG